MSLHNDTSPGHANHTHHPLTPLGHGPEAFVCISLYNGDAIIPHLNLNPLQLTLLIVTTLFFLFLLGLLPFHIRRLREKSVPVRKLFFTFLWLLCSVNALRLILSWLVWRRIDVGGEILWILTSSLIFAVEVSFIIFVFSSGLSSSRSIIIRILFWTGVCGAIFLTLQVLLVFAFNVKIYDYTRESMFYWGPLNALKLVFYIVILALPCTKCAIPLPRKRPFYVYLVLLMLMHLMHCIGDVLIVGEVLGIGFCFIDSGVMLYYSFYAPVFYFTVLYDFFHREETPMLAFEIEYDQ